MFSSTTLTQQEALELLGCRRLPGRLASAETAALLGFQLDDLRVLVSAKLLCPLGKPTQNAPKYYSSTEVLKHAADPKWLDRATAAVSGHWRRKNARKTKEFSIV